MPDPLESRLRDHLRRVASTVDVPDRLDELPASVSDVRRWPPRALGAVAAVVALIGAVTVLARADDRPTFLLDATGDSATTVPDDAATTTSTSTTTTTTTSPPGRTSEQVSAERAELDADVAAVQRYVNPRPSEDGSLPNPNPRYDHGGLAYDLDAEPVRLTVTFWQNLEHHRTALLPLLAHPDRVDVVQGQEIDMAALSRRLDEQLPPGSWWTRPSPGQLPRTFGEVGLYEGYDDIAEWLLAEHGTSVRITVGALPFPIVAAYGDVCGDPLPGPTRGDIDVEVVPERAQWRRGEIIRATVVVTNNSSEDVSFDPRLSRSLVAGDGRQPVAHAQLGGSPGDLQNLTLAPGQRSEPIRVEARQAACTASPAGSVLPAGTYDLVVEAAGAEGRATIGIAG
jgi:hypothetical protein